nr:MAG TPA: hypothetical protein [Caudoviricetes sp.]
MNHAISNLLRPSLVPEVTADILNTLGFPIFYRE